MKISTYIKVFALTLTFFVFCPCYAENIKDSTANIMQNTFFMGGGNLSNFRSDTLSHNEIGTDVISKNGVSTIEESMNGTLLGLYSIKKGGQKYGARNYDFFVRGKVTSADASPLILIDGVETDIDLLDFYQIESVEVLKDAPSLAVYGMRGANGVILIKTKRGVPSGNEIRFDARFGIQTPEIWKKSLNAYEYTSLYNEALSNDGDSPLYNPDVYLNNPNKYLYPDVDFGSLFLKNQGFIQKYNFSVRGGTKKAKYYSMISYLNQDGLFGLPDNEHLENQRNYKRYNFRTNLDVDLGSGYNMNVDIFTGFDFNTSPFISSAAGNTANTAANDIAYLILNLPVNAFPVENKNGTLGGTGIYTNNPLGILSRGSRVDEQKMLFAGATISKELNFIVPGLTAFGRYDFQNYNTAYKSVFKKFAVYQYAPETDSYTSYGVADTKNNIEGKEIDYARSNNIYFGLSYKKSFNQHDLKGIWYYHQQQVTRPGDNPDYRYQGLSFGLEYDYKHRYSIEFTGSYQGSNSFEKGKRFGFFPALGLYWIVSNEDFFKQNQWINYVKLNVASGLTGNDKVRGSRFAHRQKWYAGGGYGFGNPNTIGDGSYEGTLASSNATWERGYKANAGINARLLDHSLVVAIDLFYERRTRVMTEQSNNVPNLIGIKLPYISNGIIDNKGVEASISYQKHVGDFDFMFGGNYLFARNKIVDLNEPVYEYKWMYKRGNSINTRYGFQDGGIYRTPADLIGQPASAYTELKPGDIKYLNKNGDNLINELDVVPIGNSFPELIYGINAGIKYKNMDLMCYGEGASLFTVYSIPSQFSVYAKDNRWTNADSEGLYPRLSLKDTHNTQTSTFWQQSGSFFRISSVEIGYTLPSKLVSAILLSDVRVYCNINNLYNFNSEREGRNPEALGAGFTEYPLLKSFLFGLSIKL